jgi:hypothetical protein
MPNPTCLLQVKKSQMLSASMYHSDNERPELTGLFYDGISSRAHPVFVTIVEGQCRISGKGIDRSIPLAEVSVSERLDGAHRILRFGDGSSCELPTAAGSQSFSIGPGTESRSFRAC